MAGTYRQIPGCADYLKEVEEEPMKQTIAKTDLYSIEIDTVKNRVYLAFTGFCRSPEDMPDFLDNVKKAVQGLKNGFTLLTDASQMKVPSPEVVQLHEKSQKIWIEAGISRTGEVMPESNVVRMALDRYAKTSGMAKQGFKTMKEAEVWLDSPG